MCWDHGHLVKTAAGAGDAWTGADNSMRTIDLVPPPPGLPQRKTATKTRHGLWSPSVTASARLCGRSHDDAIGL